MILVIGGAGYIGSHMILTLNELGYETLCFDNLCRGHRELCAAHHFVEGDLRDPTALKNLFDTYPIEGVMHFAALSLVGESVAKPAEYYDNNVRGVLNLFDAMMRNDVTNLVFSSSAAVYGEPDEVPIKEEHPMRPKNPYGETKRIVEDLSTSYCQAYGCKVTTLRYFNAAGADEKGRTGEDHEPESHIIPLAISAAQGRQSFALFGNDYDTPDGTCIRDYVHVSDLATAHVLALERMTKAKDGYREAFNLGCGTGYSNLEIVESVRRVTGAELPFKWEPRRPGDPAKLVASSEKATKLLGWKRKYDSLDSIVQTAWNWSCRRFK